MLLRGLPTVTRPDRRLRGIEINQLFRDEALLLRRDASLYCLHNVSMTGVDSSGLTMTAVDSGNELSGFGATRYDQK